MFVRAFVLAALLATGSAVHAQGPRQAEERELFRKIVEMPTVQGRTEEFRKLTRLLTAEFRKAGITNVVVKDHDGTQTLIARWPAAKPDGRRPILLLAHMDVVEANPADWQNPPFEFREQDGYYLGRGTADNKSALTGIVLALQEMRRQGFQPARDIIVLFTGDEETDMHSIRRASTEWRDLIDAEYALNFDAGGGSVFKDGRVEGWFMQIAEKTYADYRLVATNRGGHSSVPRPDNAIHALAGAITAVERHRFEPMINDATRAQFELMAANDPGLFGELIKQFLSDPTEREAADLLETVEPGSTRTRCVTTMLSGGHAPNALPQRAEANVNCRIFPGVTIESVRQQLQQLAGPDVTVATIEESTTPETEASPLREDITQAYRAAVGTRFPDAPIIPYMSAGATDGSYLRAAGIPVYGVAGGWGIVGQKSGAHGLDEKVLIEGFHGQVPITVDLIRRLAGGAE
jgi:acetylornithine deacetylase/succinyl-diaminopimelate desuccinylase-like protein